MSNKYFLSATKFWNNPQTIEWFKKESIPEYWLSFFSKAKKIGIKRVLDLGCGAGRNTKMLLELGYDFYACDLYDGMIKATVERLLEAGANKKMLEERILKASMLKLPFMDHFFDAIISNGVYHNAFNLEELDHALRESARVLKRGGYLCFNLFSSKKIASDLKYLGESVYLTKENLLMTLVSQKRFLALAKKYSLKLLGKVIEYEREVSTGKRTVMRGIFRKER